MTRSTLLAITLAGLVGCSSSTTTPSHYDAQANAQAATSADPAPLAGQPTYSSPEEAVQALYLASTAKDLPGMARIVGLPESDLVTPDAARNASMADFFRTQHDAYHRIVPDGDARARLFIGADNFPLASAMVKKDDRWFFDSAGGKQALIARYIGENEAATIAVCRAYVQAQYEYYAEDTNNDDVLEYAQRLASADRQRDGLYWPTATGEKESPLGPLIAQARATGYLDGGAQRLDEPKPYHGYVFRILTRQGASAPGGAHDYIINNHMIAGFALVAYPAKYAKSGTMTFLVGANGKVFQKDLGTDTASIAGGMAEYNPDSSWTYVSE